MCKLHHLHTAVHTAISNPRSDLTQWSQKVTKLSPDVDRLLRETFSDIKLRMA